MFSKMEMDRLRKENKKLKECVETYGNTANYETDTSGDIWVECDQGKYARECLEELINE